MKTLLILVSAVATLGAQQTINGGRVIEGDVSIKGATATIRSGASLPANCLSGPPQELFIRTSDNTLFRCSAANTWTNVSSSNLQRGVVYFVLDGGGSAIEPGVKSWVQIPYSGTIASHELTCNQTGSIVLDLWKATYANFPPTAAGSITAAAKPTLSNAQKAQDSTLTGWTKTIDAKDYIRLNVDSASTVTQCVLTVHITKN